MYQKVDLEKLLKEKKISQRTFDKVTIAKQIIERKYNLQGSKYTEWNNIIEKINSLDISEEQKDKIKQEIYNLEVTKYRKAREKQSIRDYESLSIIGRGAFGEVHVCREKKTGQIVAVKKIRKDVLILKFCIYGLIALFISLTIIVFKLSRFWQKLYPPLPIIPAFLISS